MLHIIKKTARILSLSIVVKHVEIKKKSSVICIILKKEPRVIKEKKKLNSFFYQYIVSSFCENILEIIITIICQYH